ncbi:MAG: hypothetical protein RBT60_09685 [Candidatus Krumholzibacteria bacterium]|nr:hypothetical protein [Candidatus Krumholzibacteria bacterium]
MSVLILLCCQAIWSGVVSPPADADYARWRPLLAAELAQTGAESEPQDLYKFLHQGVLGPAHAAGDPSMLRARLRAEWIVAAALPAAGRPPLVVPLRPDSGLVRVDLGRLGRYVWPVPSPVAGVDSAATVASALDTLLGGFVATASCWAGETERLASLWQSVVADTALWCDYYHKKAVQDLTVRVTGGWPAVHHSSRYRERWRPHYRVTAFDRLPLAWRQWADAEAAP